MHDNKVVPVDGFELEKDNEYATKAEPVVPREGKLTLPLVVTVFAIVIGCSFQFGYHTGCINSSKPVSTMRTKSFWKCFRAGIVALYPFGAVFGSWMGAPLADRFGRKMTLFANLIPAVLAGVLFLLTYFCKCWPLLFPGRFLIGINSGITSSAAVTYITEVAPINLRGMLGSCHQLIVTIGILLANVVSFDFLLGTHELWIIIYAITFVPVVIQFVLLLFCPESPQFTLMFKKNESKATKDLRALRKEHDVRNEIELIKQQNSAAQSEKVRVIELFGYEYRWATFAASLMMVMQQFSGINAAMYYSGVIFQKAGLTGTTNTLATCGLMIANVLMTIVSTYLVDHPRFGRRALLLSGIVGMFFCTIISVIALCMVDNEIATGTFQVIAVVFMVLFVVSFATGPGSIPWFYVMELFSSDARASASAIACSVNWFSNVLVGLLFPVIQEYLGSYTFLIFAACLVICGTIIFFYIPETKGRTIDENKIAMESKRPRWI